MKPRMIVFAVVLTAVCASILPASADDSARYAVAKAGYKAENPASRFQLDFSPTGVVVRSERSDDGPWSFDLRLLGISFDGQVLHLGPPQRTALDNGVDYDFAGARVSYVNGPKGLVQKITIAAPENPGRPGVLSVVTIDLSIDGGLVPVPTTYFIDMLKPSSEAVLRFGPIDARDAKGTLLDARLEIATDSRGGATGLRVVINTADPVYPIDITSKLAARVLRETPPQQEAPPVVAEVVGVPVAVGSGITETVDDIMERERRLPPQPVMPPRATHPEFEGEDENRQLEPDPNAPPPLSHWPPIPELAQVSSSADPGPPNLPQTVGTQFKALGLSDTGAIPPDSMGDVGPTQILVHTNGRIRVYSKAGVLGPLNATTGSFWASVAGGAGFSDPMVRYDRLSGRWFVIGITTTAANNRVLLAVSSGPTITGAASFTFFQFNIGTVTPSEAGSFCDYPGFGVDANALYVGCNMFGGAFHITAYVIRKSSVTGAPPMVVTGFANIGAPYSPRGVDNDDPTATEGYIIGTDVSFLNRINIRRISNPGGTPTMGPTITLAVSNTNNLDQAAMGSTTPINSLNARLFSAKISKNKLTGVSTLWTAHSVETTTTCTPAESGNNRRLGAKWYQIGSMTTTPTITQFGTLCTTATGSATSNTERGFIFPTVVQTGQGHMALSASYASATEFVGVAAAGRLRTDPAGGTRAPETIVLTGSASYVLLDGTRNRWGDYSFTDVDPTDDQTVWTFQEYADTPANNWSVRAVQLRAPAPPAITSSSNAVCIGPAAPVNIIGSDICAVPTCTNGLCTGGGPCPEFFDPGPDTGGPGFANRIQASVTGGVVVNSANIILPANPATQRVTQVALSLDTSAAAPGLKTVTITNPDGQAVVGSNRITVVANRVPVAITGNYFSCQNGSIQLNGALSSDPDSACGDSLVSYEWDLNNDGTFETVGVTPSVTYAQLTSMGLVVGSNVIKLKVTDTHAAPNTGTGSITLVVEGGACQDGNGCTQTDSCNAGTCVGANPVVCTPLDQCHDAGVCNPVNGVCSNPNKSDGSSCSDANACTLSDTCQTGACVSGSPKDCGDANTCTSDLCDTGTGNCSNPNVTNGTGCNDVNSCTQTDSCQEGACTGSNPVVCTAFSQCHVPGVCNPGTGICSNPPAPDGTTCNDSNACSQTDTCQVGTCTGLNPVVCTPSDSCHLAGTCNPGTGVCSNPNAPNGTGCEDGDFCTSGETCTSGACGGGVPAPPGEIANARFSDDKVTLLWDSVPNSPNYDVLRGAIGALPVGPGGGDEFCFDNNGVSLLSDGTTPLADEGFWYLIRAETTCGVGGYGTQKDLTPRTSTTCP